MKKFIAILTASLALLLCAGKAHAQDIILTHEGELIMAVVTEINDAEIVYKASDNQQGPNYKIAIAKVQKIRFSNGTEQVFAQPQPAQQSDAPSAFQAADRTPSYNAAPEGLRSGYMEHVRGEFELAGRELYEGEYRNYFNADEFETINSAMSQRRAGKGLMIAGGAVLGVGTAVFGASYYCWVTSFYDGTGPDYTAFVFSCTGAALMGVGGTLMTIGIPLFCVGNGRLNWAASSYNQRNQLALSLGAGRDGAGLFLRF